MAASEFQIRFEKAAAVDLPSDAKLVPWDTSSPGMLRFTEGTIQLDGCCRPSTAGRILGSNLLFGVLGSALTKPLVSRAQYYTVLPRELRQVVVLQGWRGDTFHLFRRGSDGQVEVHVFTANRRPAARMIESLKTLVPNDIVFC